MVLYSGLVDAKFHDRQIVILQAYFDDSVKSVGRKRLFLAGYVNSGEKWLKFSEDWQRALSEGKPIKFFKGSQAGAMRGQFRNWGRLDRDVKLHQLADVVERSQPASYHISIDLDAFEEHMQRDGVPWGLRSQYWFAFEAIIVKILQASADTGVDEKIDFIFDEQTQIHRSVASLWEALLAAQPDEWRQLAGSPPIFRSDADILPLQAADMLAWHVQRETFDGHFEPRRKITSKLVAAEHRYIDFNKPILEHLGQELFHIGRFADISTKKDWHKVLDSIDEVTAQWRFSLNR